MNARIKNTLIKERETREKLGKDYDRRALDSERFNQIRQSLYFRERAADQLKRIAEIDALFRS